MKIEGEFRLRFSLFEMLKYVPVFEWMGRLGLMQMYRTQVVYIKSVTSEPFNGDQSSAVDDTASFR